MLLLLPLPMLLLLTAAPSNRTGRTPPTPSPPLLLSPSTPPQRFFTHCLTPHDLQCHLPSHHYERRSRLSHCCGRPAFQKAEPGVGNLTPPHPPLFSPPPLLPSISLPTSFCGKLKKRKKGAIGRKSASFKKPGGKGWGGGGS